MFRNGKVWRAVCLVVLIAVVISFIQLRPVKMRGNELAFKVRKGWNFRLSFVGETVYFHADSLSPFVRIQSNEEVVPWKEEYNLIQNHEDSPSSSQYPYYSDYTFFSEGTHSFSIKGQVVHIKLVDDLQPNEEGYIEDSIEMFMFPTLANTVGVFTRNLLVLVLLFGLGMQLIRFFEKRKVSWVKREILLNKELLILIIFVVVISIFLITSISLIQMEKREYVGTEEGILVPVNWLFRIKSPSGVFLSVESEEPIHFVEREQEPSPICRDFAYRQGFFNFTGSPEFGTGRIRMYESRYVLKDGYFFWNLWHMVCPGDYTWEVLGGRAFIVLEDMPENLFGDHVEQGETFVEVYPSKRAKDQIIFNNLKLILLIDFLIFATVFVARRVKIKKIE